MKWEEYLRENSTGQDILSRYPFCLSPATPTPPHWQVSFANQWLHNTVTSYYNNDTDSRHNAPVYPYDVRITSFSVSTLVTTEYGKIEELQ